MMRRLQSKVTNADDLLYAVELIGIGNEADGFLQASGTARESPMRWPKIIDADLNAFVYLELAANDLTSTTAHLFADAKVAERATAYVRQQRSLAALRAEVKLLPLSPRLNGLQDELCRLVRQQDEFV